jgi:hypothetical protein
MRHAQPAPRPGGALAVAMVRPALGARLMAAARRAETPHPASPTTRLAAVRMAPIAGPAEEERPLTPAADTDAEERHRWSGAARSPSPNPAGHRIAAVARTTHARAPQSPLDSMSDTT